HSVLAARVAEPSRHFTQVDDSPVGQETGSALVETHELHFTLLLACSLSYQAKSEECSSLFVVILSQVRPMSGAGEGSPLSSASAVGDPSAANAPQDDNT